MATQVQRRRGTDAEHRAFTGALGEFTMNTDTKSIHAHDGATPGGWAQKLVVSVKDYGAVGDGVADDTSAIQDAVDSVAAGGYVFFPKGTYRATSQISVNTTDVTFQGESRRQSELKFDDGAYTGIKTSTTGAQDGMGFALLDMNVRGTTNISPQIQLADFTNNSPYVVVQRCILGFADVCLRLGETYVVKILDNQIGNCNTGVLARPDGSQADCIIRGNTFGTCPDTTDPLLDLQFAGVVVDCNYFETQTRKKPCCVFKTGCQRASFTNNLAQVENGLLVQVEPSIRAVIANNNASASYDETNERVIRIDGGSLAAISGNYIRPDGAASGIGISVSGTAVITGNIIDGCANQGCSLGAGALVGNLITNCGTGASVSGSVSVGLNTLTSNTTDLALTGGDPIAAFNYATTMTEAAADAAVFGNTPRRVAAYERYGQTTYNPDNLADGAGATTTVSCSGAALGDFAEVSFSNDLQGVVLTAWVSASNTVSVRFQNETGGAVDLASGTLRVKTRKGA